VHNLSPEKLFELDAERTQALRIKKIKATIRMSPSNPPPIYMRFPFMDDSDVVLDHEDESVVRTIPYIPHGGIYLD
jgi:hypothetical protein